MKKPVNLNYIWSKFFVDQLALYGLKNVCISPGSRSTPLTTAFAENKKVKKYVIVDERSSAFFAMGLAKESGLPTAVVTTSGTATANLYPAIIEAYQSRIPLIICTTDRPEYLRSTGANQTINQVNLYKNHIRLFEDILIPNLLLKSFKSLQSKAKEAYLTAVIKNRGPVHLNFQFEKPLEKSVCNIEIDNTFLKKLNNLKSPIHPITPSPSFSPSSLHPYSPLTHSPSKKMKTIVNKINTTTRGIILVGWDNYGKGFLNQLLKLSKAANYPVLADGASGIYLKSNHKNIIVNHQAFLRDEKFIKKYSPELIIHFGNAPTSNAILDFIKNSDAYKIGINFYGERKDSGYPFNQNIKAEPEEFCKAIVENVKFPKDKSFLSVYQKMDNITEDVKNNFYNSIKITDEIGIVKTVIETLPKNSNLFISNSLPIRDLEFFKSRNKKNINLFVNRGASGIDGINSTAAGIAASSKHPTVLVTGDLSFFHDSNGLQAIAKNKIPLTIILINNGGGAIFGMLPVGKEKEVFNEYFFTSTGVNFSQLIKIYNGKYSRVKNFPSLSTKITESIINRDFSLLEIKTNNKKGIELRKDYFRKVISEIEKVI